METTRTIGSNWNILIDILLSINTYVIEYIFNLIVNSYFLN